MLMTFGGHLFSTWSLCKSRMLDFFFLQNESHSGIFLILPLFILLTSHRQLLTSLGQPLFVSLGSSKASCMSFPYLIWVWQSWFLYLILPLCLGALITRHGQYFSACLSWPPDYGLWKDKGSIFPLLQPLNPVQFLALKRHSFAQY